MADRRPARRTRSQPRNTAPLRPPSSLDRLFAWIEALPGPAWLFYGVSTLVFVVLGHGLRWMDGSMAVGSFDRYRLAIDVLTVYALALTQYLNGRAGESLVAFRPALGDPARQYGSFQQQLTSMSQRSFVASAAVGVLISAGSLAADPVAWGLTPGSSVVTRVFTLAQVVLEIAPFFVLILHSIQQLRLITRLHQEATGVNLYARETHHAFSRFTVRAAIGLVLPVYLWSMLALLTQGSLGAMSGFDTGIVIFLLVISGGVFVLPLNGMHSRLAREKSRLIQEVDGRIERTVRTLHERVDSADFSRNAELYSTLSALTIEKENLKKVSTWPWQPDTMRGFLSSIGLPILLRLLTRYLGRFLE